MALPQIEFHTLDNADGSVTYTASNKTHTIIAGINYPIEVPYRSDEIPDSTFIDVNLRPHNAVSMVRERHVEALVKATLQTIVRIEDTPRTMLQVTLQVASAEVNVNLPGGIKDGGQGETYLPILTSAINAAVLACLDGGVHMKQIAGAVLVGITRGGTVITAPNVLQQKKCKSLHCFGMTAPGKNDILLMESEGVCNLADVERALNEARSLIQGDAGLLSMMREAVTTSAARHQRWTG